MRMVYRLVFELIWYIRCRTQAEKVQVRDMFCSFMFPSSCQYISYTPSPRPHMYRLLSSPSQACLPCYGSHSVPHAQRSRAEFPGPSSGRWSPRRRSSHVSSTLTGSLRHRWDEPDKTISTYFFTNQTSSYCKFGSRSNIRYLATLPLAPWAQHPAHPWVPQTRPVHGTFPDRIRSQTSLLIEI